MRFLLAAIFFLCSVSMAETSRTKEQPLNPEVTGRIDQYLQTIDAKQDPHFAVMLGARQRLVDSGWVRTAKSVRAQKEYDQTSDCREAGLCDSIDFYLEEIYQRSGKSIKFSLIGMLLFKDGRFLYARSSTDPDITGQPGFEFTP